MRIVSLVEDTAKAESGRIVTAAPEVGAIGVGVALTITLPSPADGTAPPLLLSGMLR